MLSTLRKIKIENVHLRLLTRILGFVNCLYYVTMITINGSIAYYITTIKNKKK